MKECKDCGGRIPYHYDNCKYYPAMMEGTSTGTAELYPNIKRKASFKEAEYKKVEEE